VAEFEACNVKKHLLSFLTIHSSKKKESFYQSGLMLMNSMDSIPSFLSGTKIQRSAACCHYMIRSYSVSF